MISVILYGRNDSHGYNLHKRAAISLNCIAEVLTSESDEILFVDYNTPNDLPTFIEAIYDTLTRRAKALLRVLRVRPEIHEARLGGRTHLLALEPHSRNIGLRRSNPANRWVLFTNTDMVFVPKPGVTSLSSAVEDLPDGQYILPRFELPEPLWEGFDRADPQAIIRACDDLGRTLHLNEITVTHPYMRFDSPGDFQLIPRQALFDVHGFDERMIHGWHADSNMCKRFYVLYGHRTDSLAHRLKGYHCDHTRVATLAHRLDIKLENDLHEFVYDVADPYASHQADTWGMPEEQIEEVDFAAGPAARFIESVANAAGEPQRCDYTSNAIDLRNFVFYHPEHALPYLAANLTVYPLRSRFTYVGANPQILRMAAQAAAGMGFTEPIAYLSTLLDRNLAPNGTVALDADAASDGIVAATVIRESNVVIFDFGVDGSRHAAPEKVAKVTDWPRELRYKLGRVAHWLEACVDAAEKNHRAADFLVLNANHYVFNQFVSQFLVATETPYNTHVRKGRPRVGQERFYKSARWKYTEELLRSYFAYGVDDQSVPVIAAGDVIDLTSCGTSARSKDGHWGAMDLYGTWTDGSHVDLLFSPAPELDGDLIAFVRVVETFLGPDEQPIRFSAHLDGVQLASWSSPNRYATVNYRVMLPLPALKGKNVCRLSLRIENPQSAEQVLKARGRQIIGEDPRELGVRVQRVSFCGVDRLGYALGTVIDYTKRGSGGFHLDERWTQPDRYGAWTLGPDASFTVYPSGASDRPLVAFFTVSDAVVSPEYPSVRVLVSFNGREAGAWELGPRRITEEKQAVVPSGTLAAGEPLTIAFHIDPPRTPIQLKWSDTDTRELGFRLTRFRMEPAAG